MTLYLRILHKLYNISDILYNICIYTNDLHEYSSAIINITK